MEGAVSDVREWRVAGRGGEIVGRTWEPAGSARWLVGLVPGYGDHLGRYPAVVDALVGAGAVVVGHDHAGHGRSGGEPGVIADFEAVVDDVRTVVSRARDEFPGLPTVLIGFSVGGTAIARFAQRFPDDVDGLVLVAPVLGTWPAIDLLEQDVLPAPAFAPELWSRDTAVVTEFRDDPLVWQAAFPRVTLTAVDEILRTIDFDHPLGDQLPALWLHGTDDEIAPEAETRTGMDRIRGLRFEERSYPGARHDLFHEINAAEVVGDVVEFLVRTFPG